MKNKKCKWSEICEELPCFKGESSNICCLDCAETDCAYDCKKDGEFQKVSLEEERT